jgi:hypothetical protein
LFAVVFVGQVNVGLFPQLVALVNLLLYVSIFAVGQAVELVVLPVVGFAVGFAVVGFGVGLAVVGFGVGLAVVGFGVGLPVVGFEVGAGAVGLVGEFVGPSGADVGEFAGAAVGPGVALQSI